MDPIKHLMTFQKDSQPKKLLGGGWTNPFETYARQIGSFP